MIAGDQTIKLQSKTFFVDATDLTATAFEAWLAVLDAFAALVTTTLDVVVHGMPAAASTAKTVARRFSPEHIRLITDEKPPGVDWSRNQVFIFSSAALSSALLRTAENVYLRPNGPPAARNAALHTDDLIEAGAQALARLPVYTPRCTLLTSLFDGEAHIDSFLANLSGLHDYAALEHWVVRPASPGDEHARLMTHGRAHPNLIYLWLAQDPGLYEVWNRLSQLSTAPYLSNANVDDKRAPEQVSVLVSELDARPEIDVASTALWVTTDPMATWDEPGAYTQMFTDGADREYGPDALLQPKDGQTAARNIPHCMPVWRNGLQVTQGGFDERRFGPSADWAFWLSCGVAGCRFYHTVKPLGLHLKAPNSYWRRRSAEQDFEQRVLRTFVQANGTLIPAPPAELLAPRIERMINAFRNALWTEALWEFRTLLLAWREQRSQQPSLEPLLRRMAQRYLNIQELSAFDAYVDTRATFSTRDRWDRLFDFAAFCVTAANLAVRADCHSYLGFATRFDMQSGWQLGELLRARLYGRIGEHQSERRLLQAAWRRDAAWFWSNIQRVYRFERTLSQWLALLCESPQLACLRVAVPQRWFFYPHYRRNPYQSLLYADLARTDVELQGFDRWDELCDAASALAPGDVLHLHWITALVRHRPAEVHAEQFQMALRWLGAMKARGVRLYWTVHNSVRQDSPAPAAEEAFRRALSQLADQVFLHHPMQEAEIAHWLAPQAPLAITEHGHYLDAYPNTMDATTARQSLGLGQDDVVVLIAGYIRPYKGLAPKLPILATWLRGSQRRKLLIAGEIACPETRSALNLLPHEQTQVKDGFVAPDELQRYFNAASIVLLSYQDNLTSGSLAQAMSFGRPVLAPASGSLPYYVADGVNGWLYRQPEQLPAFLESLCSQASSLAALQANCLNAARRLAWPSC